jgi:hypothetical protein
MTCLKISGFFFVRLRTSGDERVKHLSICGEYLAVSAKASKTRNRRIIELPAGYRKHVSQCVGNELEKQHQPEIVFTIRITQRTDTVWICQIALVTDSITS